MKVQSSAARRDGRGAWMRASWLIVVSLVLVGLGASTCDPFENVLISCDSSEDCEAYPGTHCFREMCVCALASEQFCGGSCRPVAECRPSWSDEGYAEGGGGAAGGGGTGGVSIECSTPADCEQPGDLRCGKATCSGGVCGLELKPFSRLASQRAGDCKERWCDGQGNLVELTEGTDVYQDALPCTVNSCYGREPAVTLIPNGETCPAAGSGVCHDGQCVPCIQDLIECGGGLVCSGNQCLATHCLNQQWDPGSGETAEDCGSTCLPCSPGSPCNVASDCLSGVCASGNCQPPTCSDGVKNDSETGVDCGGPPNCQRCPAGQGCQISTDCRSGVCWAGVCEAPSCADGFKNGDEVGEDCGGSCGACP